MNKTLLLIAVLLLTVVFFILILILTPPKDVAKDAFPAPSPNTAISQPEDINKDVAVPNDFSEIPEDYSSRVGQLIEELPYSGKLFSLSYDFSNDTFILELDKQSPSDAEKEFDNFLKTRGIQNRSQLQKLVIR